MSESTRNKSDNITQNELASEITIKTSTSELSKEVIIKSAIISITSTSNVYSLVVSNWIYCNNSLDYYIELENAIANCNNTTCKDKLP